MADIKKILEQAIGQLKAKGADKGQVFVTESETREFNAESGEFTLFRTLFDQDINIIAYKNQKKGSYYTNKLDEASVNSAVDMAMTSMESGEVDEAYDIAPDQGSIEAHKGVYEPDVDLLFTRTKELVDDIKTNHPKIVIQQLVVNHSRRHMVFANTNGTFCDEYIGSYLVTIGIAGHEGDTTTSLVYTGVKLDNLDKPFMEVGDIKAKIKVAEEQIEMKPMEGKFTGTMVLTPGCLGSFMYYTAGLINGGVILDRTSIWLDKIGKQVADSRVSIKLDPHDDRIVCGETLTFDGFKAEAYDLIKEGKLQNFIINQYIAKKTGYAMSKNDGFDVIVESGEKSIEDIIRNIKQGILVGEFSGGQPGTNGDFSGVAKNSYLIENGKITGPVSEAMINGNIAAMFMNLVDISKESVCDGTSVLPYMAFDGIVVSGK